MITIDIIKTIKEIAHDRLVASRDMNDEAQTDSGTAHANVLIAHTHQDVFALEIDAHVGVLNIRQ